MVGTITPLVKAARATWLTVMLLFAVGSTGAAVAAGGFLGWIGFLVRHPLEPSGFERLRPFLLLGILMLAVIHQLGWLTVPLPERRRSISQRWWLFGDRYLVALLYGVTLGLGFVTHIRFATYWVAVAWILLFGTPATGAMVLGAHGLARSVAVAATAHPVLRATDPWQGAVTVRTWILTKLRKVELANAVALLLFATVWAYAVVGSIDWPIRAS